MSYVHETILQLERSSPAQTEFYQAVEEVLESLRVVLETHKKYREHAIIERIVEPERQIMFRVPWMDDHGKIHVNKGYRIEFNSALGPYKGGLLFHPNVDAGVIKFLGFEQIFKNALTGLPLGAGKGGANFNPKGRSEAEIMRFCQSFKKQLYRHVGPQTDVPAGDIGVGAREIGYLFGQYKRPTGRYEGVITGKGLLWGARSLARKEATGYGCVYFAHQMLADKGLDLAGRDCLESGAGNVAIYAIEKLYAFGARPITCSDSTGMIHDPRGIDLETLKRLKEVQKAGLEEYARLYAEARFVPIDGYPDDGHALWRIPAELAFPCATQNELTGADAEALVDNGCIAVVEGANMPSTPEAADVLQAAKTFYGPGKAANAGGVDTSQLEMSQNASMQCGTFEQVDTWLKAIMAGIYARARDTAIEFDAPDNLVLGANVAGFMRVADAMIEQGLV